MYRPLCDARASDSRLRSPRGRWFDYCAVRHPPQAVDGQHALVRSQLGLVQQCISAED